MTRLYTVSILAIKTLLRSPVAVYLVGVYIVLSAMISAVCSVADSLYREALGLSERVYGSGTANIVCRDAATCREAVEVLREAGGLRDYLYMSLYTGSLETERGYVEVPVVYVDTREYFSETGARLSGRAPERPGEVVVGEVFSRTTGVVVGTVVSVYIDGRPLRASVTGVFSTGGPDDTAVLVYSSDPCREPGVCVVRVFFRDYNSLARALERLEEMGLEVSNDAVNTGLFIESVAREAIGLIDLWRTAVLLAVAVSSYIVSLRLSIESRETIERVVEIGGGAREAVAILFSQLVFISLTGSVVGASLGLVATQIVSRVAGWATGSVLVRPVLEPLDLLTIVSGVLTVSVAGGLAPILRTRVGSWRGLSP